MRRAQGARPFDEPIGGGTGVEPRLVDVIGEGDEHRRLPARGDRQLGQGVGIQRLERGRRDARTARLGRGEPDGASRSSIADLVRWTTGRRSWRDLGVRLDGDTGAGARFCDAVDGF